MKSIIFLIPLMLSSTVVVATTAGSFKNTTTEENATFNPIVTINAGSINGESGQFIGGNKVKSTSVKKNTKWSQFKKTMPTPTLSGYDIIKWTFDSTSGEEVTDDYVFTENVTIVANWGATAASSFANDSWATVLAEANKGYANLKSVYESDLSLFGNTFIIQDYTNSAEVAKKTRKIVIPNIGTFNVRVIGENADTITETGKKSVLTFEFSEVITPNISFSNSSKPVNTYSSSDLKTFINTMLFYRLPTVLQANIKAVDKTTGGVSSSEKLFPLSLSEMAFTDVASEGSAYTFYTKNYAKTTLDPYALIKKYNGSEKLAYWTRSASDTASEAYVINNDPTNIKLSSSVTVVRGIAPCFAVGTEA